MSKNIDSHLWSINPEQVDSTVEQAKQAILTDLMSLMPEKLHIPEEWKHEPGRTAIHAQWHTHNAVIDEVEAAIKNYIQGA